MKMRTRIVSSIAVAMASITVAMTMGSAFTPSAYAEGKATLGCSPPFKQNTITFIYHYSLPLVDRGFFTEASLTALLTSIDRNGDGSLCSKTPPGWLGPPATNAAHLLGYLDLVENKVVGG
jgi:hypothetical protein